MPVVARGVKAKESGTVSAYREPEGTELPVTRIFPFPKIDQQEYMRCVYCSICWKLERFQPSYAAHGVVWTCPTCKGLWTSVPFSFPPTTEDTDLRIHEGVRMRLIACGAGLGATLSSAGYFVWWLLGHG